jgi:hypothetical protein
MSDIFISYSNKDRPWVEQFAKVLAEHGWSVWWDRQIPTGESFDTVIEQELLGAKCVIVVWSQHSVVSDWVKTEAATARERKVLLPVLIDDAKLPLEFKRVQTQFLRDWQDGRPHPGFDQLVRDIARVLGGKLVEESRPTKSWWAQVRPFWLLSLPTIIVAMIVTGLMLWSIPAIVQVELTTKRIEFVVDSAQVQGKAILGPLDARSVAIDKFTTISFEPETFEVADPSQYDMKIDDFPPPAWKPLRLASANITLAAKDSTRHPRVTVEGPNRNGLPTIRLDPIVVAPAAHVTLEARGEKTSGLTIKIAGQEGFKLPVHEPVKLTAQHTEVRGIADVPFQDNEELTYRIRLPDRASWIEIAASPDGLVVSPTFPPSQPATTILSGVPVTTMEFTEQGPSGDQVSALTGKGTITFPDYPHLDKVSISEHEAIGLERLDRFTIEQVTFAPGGDAMSLVGNGMAKQIRTKTGQLLPIKHHLTAFDALWHSPQLAVFFAIVVWVFPTTLGAYRLWKEFRR